LVYNEINTHYRNQWFCWRTFHSISIEKKSDYIIYGVSRSKPKWDFIQKKDKIFHSITFYQCDLLDSAKINKLIIDIQPDYILHLASFSSVAQSWKEPVTSFLNNTNAFLNLVEAVRLQSINSKILSVGSSEEYGIVNKRDLPLTEKKHLSPANPYAVARVSEEQLAQVYVKGYNLNICCTRSFNHIGPGQTDNFVVSSIAKQFAEIAISHKKPVIKIGAGLIIRDFVDIDDVIFAYNKILEKGVSGEVYNVCTGRGYSINDIIGFFSELTQIPVNLEQNKDLIRPIDNPILIGNYKKLNKYTGWNPRVPIKKSLEKIYNYWINKLS
jgi:GDP-4-dehydro-6-deoxy-D-mannose reductase